MDEGERKTPHLGGPEAAYRAALRRAAENGSEMAAMRRDEFEAMLQGQSDLVVDDPFTSDNPLPALPALRDGEFDLLTDARLKEFARAIVEDKVAPRIAAMAVGIPPDTMQEYVNVGSADLAAQQWTRKAVAATVAMRATYALIAAASASIYRNPMGWKNHAWMLQMMLPEHFSDKRAGKRENAATAALEQLSRQLSGAMQMPDLPEAKP